MRKSSRQHNGKVNKARNSGIKRGRTKAIQGALLVTAGLLLSSSVSVLADTYGYGDGQGRTDTVNINDYSTDVWDRFERNYEFSSGPDYNYSLGKPTNTSVVPQSQNNPNLQNNKDAAYNPPKYGVFSGDINTERSNPYFSPKNYSAVRNVTDGTITPITNSENNNGTGGWNDTNSVLASTSIINSLPDSQNSATTTQGTNNQPSTTKSELPPPIVSYTTTDNTQRNSELNTEPWYYSDNSIGTISIPRFNVRVKVYEGETLANLKIGLAHFSFSSAWDGNVGICGHNDQEFKYLKNLNVGDEIVYTTKYGTRTYKVSSRIKIADTDYSTLGYTTDNRLTLITCVNGVADERYSVVAIEK